MVKWWEGLNPGTQEHVVLFQFDLGSHSAWAESHQVQRVCIERTVFSMALRTRLEYCGFPCLHWLGDGGVFARMRNSVTDSEAVVAAADEAFGCFEEFKSTAQGGEMLSCRVTATLVRVLLHPEPGQWFSPELNEFLKYERRVGLRDAFVITAPLYNDLRPPIAKRFTTQRRVRIGDGMITAYTDGEHPFKTPVAQNTFKGWASNETGLFCGSAQLDQIRDAPCIGNAAILNAAPTASGYEQVTLIPGVFPREKFEALSSDFSREWNKEFAENSRFLGFKAAPLKVTFPTTDDPALYLEYGQLEYSVTRAFLLLLEKNAEVREKCMSEALRFGDKSGRGIPGSVVADVAVIIGNQNLLIAHRVDREGGFEPNRWSASFEENFAVVKTARGNEEYPSDADLEGTILRGLREEMVSSRYTKEIHVSVQAVTFDLLNLNLAFLVVVRLPDSTFEEVVELWRSDYTKDRVEHDCLATLPLDAAVLRKVLQSECPGSWAALTSDSGFKSRADHSWHSRSKSRIANCLWLLEQGLIRIPAP